MGAQFPDVCEARPIAIRPAWEGADRRVIGAPRVTVPSARVRLAPRSVAGRRSGVFWVGQMQVMRAYFAVPGVRLPRWRGGRSRGRAACV